MPATFPQEADLAGYISSLGIIDDDLLGDALVKLRCGAKTAAAKAEWERRTGFSPFLADETDVTRYFSPNGSSTIYFSGGLVEITSLTVGVTADSEGTALTHNTDFYLGPASASLESRPFEYAEFNGCQWGSPRSVVITGKWGYATEIPSDAWEACLHYSAFLCYPELALGVSRGLYSEKTLSTQAQYGSGAIGPLGSEAAAWKALFEQAVKRYRRVTI